MSLPNSEPLPENINELPPARQRHIRRQPRSASLAERQLLHESLFGLTAPALNDILLAFLGSVAVGAALYLDDPAILVLSLILLPFLRPALGLALLPSARKAAPVLKSLVSLLVLIILVFGAGALAGWLKKEFPPQNLFVYRFSAPYWLDLALVCLSTVIAAFILVRRGELPRLIGVLLAFEILLPLAIAGFSFTLGAAQVFPGALLISLTHLGLAVLMAALTFVFLGFAPKSLGGWLLLLLPALIAAGGLFLTFPDIPGSSEAHNAPSATATTAPASTNTQNPAATTTAANPQPSPTITASLTPTRTPSPSPTLTPTTTPTPEPTSFWGIVDAPSGVVLRESPTYEAPVAGYLNNGAVIEIFDVITSEEGSLWYRVSSPEGQEGWLLGSLLNTQTPTPIPE